MMTLREHLEAIRDATVPWADHEPYVLNAHAAAALAILDASTRCDMWGNDPGDPNERLVPDPEPTQKPSMEGIV